MQAELQFGIIGSYYGRPLDIILPTINEDQINTIDAGCGHCFHIFDLSNTELLLYSLNTHGARRTAKVNISKSCKANKDIGIYIVKMNNGKYKLYTYIDKSINSLYSLPEILYQ